VENARLFAESQRRIREMDALYRVDEQLHQSLVLDEVLRALTDAAIDVLDADRSAVLIFDENTRELQVRATSGLSNSQVQALVDSLNGLDATTIEKLDVPRVVPDTSRDLRMVQDVSRAVGLASVIDVPITIAGKRFGLFSMGWVDHHEINSDEVRMASAMGQRAAVAIENARLYERAQHAASLEERQRLARELHDSVSQALYGISLGTRTAKTLLERDPARVGEPLEYVSGLAEAGLAELRALIFELRPESLEAEGLLAAFEKQFAAMHARHGIVMVTSLEGEPDLRLDLKEVLYRIGQEAMHNTVKHARATKAWVTLRKADGRVTLEVRDNGVGFDPNGEFPGHLGLRSMTERATSSGGTLTIESAPGSGTTVRISVPAIPGHLPAGAGGSTA
jgi:signal transduction histidine kinase